MRKFEYVCGVLLAVIVFFITGCDDILEEDISGDVVIAVNPITNDTILGNTVNFSWLLLEGADNYRVQVKDERGAYMIDSLVSGASFLMSIEPGDYFWKLRAENFAYHSEYSEDINFTVLATDDLFYHRVILETPSNDFSTNLSEIIYTWEPIEFADSYRFQLRKMGAVQETIIDEFDLTGNSYTLDTETIGTDGEHLWRVQAVNQSSETRFSERKFTLDRQAPGAPELIMPKDQFQTPYGAVGFTWHEIFEDGGRSEVDYDFEISDDNSFLNIVFREQVEDTSLIYTFEDEGIFYWRLRAVDKAGNYSDYSNSRSLILE